MFDMEEEKLNKLNQSIKVIHKPDNINEYIRKGMDLGIKRKRYSRIKIYCNIAAVLLVALFVTSIRTLPAFAEHVSKIPGLEYLVNLINYDKGLKAAVENNFIQHINSSETHEGLTFTIKDVILDNSKGIIFYSIENKGGHHFVNLSNMSLLNERGEHLNASKNWDNLIYKDIFVEKVFNGKVEIDFNKETVLPDKISIEVKLKESETAQPDTEDKKNVLGSVWKFVIPVDKEKIKSMQKTYVLNQSIEVEGQKILFKQVTITPTRIGVDVVYDKNNTKEIFGFDDLKLINEKGEVWGTISNGASGITIDENEEILYFQSNYFTDPKELYLSGSSIRAIDKDKCTVEIDVENNKILKAPDERLSLASVDRCESSTTLNFKLKVDDPKDDKYFLNLFHYLIKDSSGNVYDRNTASVHSTMNGIQEIIITISKALDMKNHMYLTLEDYPERIKGDFKVKIK